MVATERVELREYETCDVTLPSATIAYLEQHFSVALKLLPTWRAGITLKATSYVGTIVAPGLEVRIVPKCGTKNVIAMLGWAHRLAKLRPELVGQAHVDDLREFLVTILVGHVEDLARRGMRRGYLERREDLRVLRGRLEIEQHLRRLPSARLVLPCRFEDYTADLPHNQAIRYTLQRIGAVGRPNLDGRLRRLRAAFSVVSHRPFRGADFDAFVYDRLTAHYAPIHALCRLILEALGAEDDRGAHPMGSFLVKMDTLFERFTAAWLASRIAPPWNLATQDRTPLDLSGRVTMRPDLVLYHRGQSRLVADTKYKLAAGNPNESDLYQALAYCRALRVRRAVLLYPDLSGPVPSLVTRDRENELHIDGVDLQAPWPTVEANMARLTERLLGLAAPEHAELAVPVRHSA
jgi:5-methylcytosine-specific restriction enzyme subunit McrC